MGSIYAEYLDTRASVDSRALLALQLQPKLNIWNARLNPPDAPSSIGDLRFKSINLKDRNDLVELLETEPENYDDLIAEIKSLDDEEPLFGKLKLDPEKTYSEQEVGILQDEKANQNFWRYEPITMDKMVNFVEELTDEAMRGMEERGLEPNRAEILSYVSENIFHDWDLDKSGKAVRTDRELKSVPIGVLDAFNSISGASQELMFDPEHLTFSDKFHLGINGAIEKGIYPDAIKSIVADGGTDDPQTIAYMLNFFGIDGGDDPEGMLDNVMTTWEASYTENLRSLIQTSRVSEKGTDDFFAMIAGSTTESGGPEDVFPRFAEAEKADQDLYNDFTQFNWDFNKSIEANIKSLAAVNDKTFDETDSYGNPKMFSLSPNSDEWPSFMLEDNNLSIVKKQAGKLQGDIINEIMNTTDGQAYIEALNDRATNPSLEDAFAIYKLYDELVGTNGEKFYENVLEKVDTQQTTAFREKMISLKERKTVAENYLGEDYFIGKIPDDVPQELLSFVASRVRDFDNYKDMLDDNSEEAKAFRQEVIVKSNEIAMMRPFEDDVTTVGGRESALDTFLQRNLSAEQYAAYSQASDELKINLTDQVGQFTNESDLLRAPVFMQSLNTAIADGQNRVAAKAAVTRDTARDKLNSELGERIMGELRSRGLVSSSTSLAFADHLEKNVISKMIRRAELGGGVDSMQDITALVDQHMGVFEDGERTEAGSLGAFDVFESDFIRQTADPFNPPMFPGGPSIRTEKPVEAIVFDEAFKNAELRSIALERPEFAAYLQSQMASTDFKEQWEKASKPQFDVQKFRTSIGGMERDSAEFAKNQQRLRAHERMYADIAKDPKSEEQLAVAGRSLKEEQERFRRETGVDPVTGQRRAVPKEFMPDGFAREAARRQATTPAMTTEEFIASQLPGFEKRFEESPFYQKEIERVQREDEIEQRKAEAERRRTEAERRSRLRRPTGTRGTFSLFGRRTE
tara:strand:+ start:644 stop:3559 length:2916 start_codon:yes stop_codon:yes gene_type:complete